MLERVVIVGAGWAGLAAAVELARFDSSVTILEAAPEIGGRARTVGVVDNGQHLFIGAYTELLRLLSVVGVSESDIFLRQPAYFKIQDNEGRMVLNRNVSVLVRWYISAILCFAKDETVTEWLRKTLQPKSLVRHFWAPLCQAALTTPIEQASARIFANVLKETFCINKTYSDWLFPKKTLSECFPNLARNYIEAHGGEVLRRQRVVSFQKKDNKFLVTTDKDIFEASELIVATHPKAALSLLKPHAELDTVVQQLAAFSYQPITTIYFQCPPLPLRERVGVRGMSGSVGTLGQWIFNYSDGLVAVVISGEGEHMHWPKEVLAERVAQELKIKADKYWVIREKEGAVTADANFLANQPEHQTLMPGLWLAGDYTFKGYPSSLEGAVRSGVTCAKHIYSSPSL